jgi:hypothetical protein
MIEKLNSKYFKIIVGVMWFLVAFTHWLAVAIIGTYFPLPYGIGAVLVLFLILAQFGVTFIYAAWCQGDLE